MKVFIRADASLEIGSGHVMRCLTLARELRRRGSVVSFVCRELAGNLISSIVEMGFKVLPLPKTLAAEAMSSTTPHSHWLGTAWETDAQQTTQLLSDDPDGDWLIVDHYALDAQWEKGMRTSAKRILVLDDLADRQHHCDLLLDQNYHLNHSVRYAGLLPASCRELLGPGYALLRPEFPEARSKLDRQFTGVTKVLVFFGASDLHNATLKVMRALSRLSSQEIAVDVILGANNPNRHEVINFSAAIPQFSCHEHVNDMAAMMMAADLYIGAAGTTTWERCCLGLPSVVITVAQNQLQAIRSLEQIGATLVLGEDTELSTEDIMCAIRPILIDSSRLADLSERSMALVDGMGAQRVADAMQKEHTKTR